MIGATSSLAAIISLIDGAFALMAIPTMISTVILAPKVKAVSDAYFKKREWERERTVEQERSVVE